MSLYSRIDLAKILRYDPAMENPVKKWREKRGLTQEQAARRLGITLRNYQNYEAGAYAPPESIRMLMTAVSLDVRLNPWEMGND